MEIRSYINYIKLHNFFIEIFSLATWVLMEKMTAMHNIKQVLFVDNVVSASGTNIRPREHREIDIVIKSKKYCPSFVVSEPVLIGNPQKFFKTKSFSDPRVEIYRVPCLILGSLSTNRSLSKFGKAMFGLCNFLFQLIYLIHLTLLIWALAVSKKVDLLHAHNPPDLTGLASLFVSKTVGIPYVYEVHDRAPELYCGEMGLSQTGLVYVLMKHIEKMVITNSAGVVTVNKRVAEYYKSFGGPDPLAIYTGTAIDTNQLKQLSLDNHNAIGDPIILYQGSLNMTSVGKPAIYDLMLPLKAMPRILEMYGDVVLVYVGEGSGRSKLATTAKSMKLNQKVVFTGFLPQKEVFAWVNRAQVVLIPYSDNSNCHTTVPTKLYEYMAIGKPIVATNFPGNAEIIEDGRNGLLYAVNSVPNFSNCVLRILKDPNLAQELASNAKNDFYSKYALDKNWPKLISLYDSILTMNSTSERLNNK